MLGHASGWLTVFLYNRQPRHDPSHGAPSGVGRTADATRSDRVQAPVPFAGGRPGWLYKRGPMGTGYYRDAPLNVCAAKEG